MCDCLRDKDAVLVPGGFGKRGVEGKIEAIRYARENKVPYLGICLGLQLAVIEYARHTRRAGRRAQHRVRPDDPPSGDRADPRVAWPRRQARAARRPAPTWAARCAWAGRSARCSRAAWRARSTGSEKIVERHRHRYEVNNRYIPQLMNSGIARVRHLRHRRPDGDDRAARSPLVRRLPVPPRVHLHSAPGPSAVLGVHHGPAMRQRRSEPPGEPRIGTACARREPARRSAA